MRLKMGAGVSHIVEAAGRRGGKVSRGEMALGGAAVLLAAAIWLHAAGPGAHAGTDFNSYLNGAKDVAGGHNPYHELVRLSVDTRQGASGLRARGYVYPPLLAVALSLPVRLGFGPGAIWLLWNALNVAALLWMGSELGWALNGRRSLVGTLAFLAAALLPAIATYDLWLGQADLLMAALVVGACGLWLRRSPWAGVALGVAIAIKPTMALVLLVWLWKGDWRAVARGIGAAAALIILPFALLGGTAAHDYLTFFFHWNAFQANAEYINQSPYGMLLRVFTVNPYTTPLLAVPWLVAPLRLLALAGAGAVWVWATPRGRTHDMAVAMGECLLALPLIVLLSPLSEDIHFCVIIPTLIGLCWLAWSRGLHGLKRAPATWVLVAALVFFCVPRMQELIYPSHLLVLPGQTDGHLGVLVTLLRTGTLLYVAVATLIAGAVVLRQARGWRGGWRGGLRTVD